MTNQELRNCLETLELTQAEAATILSIHPRTISRWIEGSSRIPTLYATLLNAWVRFKKLGLAWKPDQIPFAESDPNFIAQIKLLTEHMERTKAIIDKVKNRGGPVIAWNVDLKKRLATLGPFELSFDELAYGGFSPVSYRRTDLDPEITRDLPFLEDGIYCINQAIQKHGWPK